MRLELTHVGLLVELANHYTTRGAYQPWYMDRIDYRMIVGARKSTNIKVAMTLDFSWATVARVYIFTNPSARGGYDTRSISFKSSLTGLNSEFSFS